MDEAKTLSSDRIIGWPLCLTSETSVQQHHKTNPITGIAPVKHSGTAPIPRGKEDIEHSSAADRLAGTTGSPSFPTALAQGGSRTRQSCLHAFPNVRQDYYHPAVTLLGNAAASATYTSFCKTDDRCSCSVSV